MTKRILFASVSLWLFFSSYLQAQTQGLDFYLYSSERVRIIENNLQYQFLPYAKLKMQISGQSSLENRLSFNQDSKQSALSVSFSLMQKSLLHSFSSDYQTIFDASDLEPSPYVNKTAILGYQLSYEPLDSMSLSLFSKGVFRREQDRYIANNFLPSQGYWIGGSARIFRDISSATASLSGSVARKKLAWEAFDLSQIGATLSLYSNYAIWDNNFGYNNRSEDIYSLNAPTISYPQSFYNLSDNQKRSSLYYYSTLQYDPDETINIIISNNYSQNRTNYSNSVIRNNADYQNQATARVAVQLLNSLSWSNDLNHSYAIKDYNYNLNTRHTETRQVSSKLSWEYANADSLIASLSLNLQKVEFPNDAHQWDNDFLSKNYRLGWKHYWHDRIRIGNWVGYSQREEVYLDSLLSSNNKSIQSFSINPDCLILLGDRMAFKQVYLLQADYGDYIYDTGKPNTFYRQLGFRYNLILDTFPFIARTQDPRWLTLPFRNSPNNALMVDLGYAYEENQYADQYGNVYKLHTKNRRYTANLGIRHDISSFFWTVTPTYSWGTWQEYALNFGCAWEFNHGSLIDFSLTPYAEELKSVDWRSTLNLNLRF
ncbi:MAG: hypothetical protein PHO32_07325 [Candidatus Cloacimonetes bacterium]|nr:hypothetical protein [Candidatus Cloacimonadota bacterium]